MEHILEDAAAIAETLTGINNSLQDLKAELARRLELEKMDLHGYIAPRDTTLAPRVLLDGILRTKLVELSVIIPRLMPQIEAVERFITSMENAPPADKYQLQRIYNLKEELSSEYGIHVSRADILAHIWKLSTR